MANVLMVLSSHRSDPNVQVDGRLVTGQNPVSATPLAEALVRVIRAAGTSR